jgi:hypothetical protein
MNQFLFFVINNTNTTRIQEVNVAVFSFCLCFLLFLIDETWQGNPMRTDSFLVTIVEDQKEGERERERANVNEQETKKRDKICLNVYCCSRKSVFVVAIELVSGTVVSLLAVGFFITVTRPPNSSNRNGVELLLAQIN